jgi:uncharacterized membrane protein YccF (DUF307 family)
MIFGGGLLAACGWAIAALLMAISIVGLPFAPAALRIADYTLLPFGRRVIAANAPPLTTLGNILWFVLAGWWLGLGHLCLAVALAVTIVGLPFAWAHVKLARLTLAPVGTAIEASPGPRR